MYNDSEENLHPKIKVGRLYKMSNDWNMFNDKTERTEYMTNIESDSVVTVIEVQQIDYRISKITLLYDGKVFYRSRLKTTSINKLKLIELEED
jgi:hypothetical protein